MALQNQNLYTGGNAQFNPAPHVQLYISLKQREQAKNEAFDEYLRNLNKNINPAGLRNQERAVFEDKLAKWQQYGMQNREALRNPRKDQGGASLNFQSQYQDLLNTVAESKQEEEKKKPVIEVMADPDKRKRLRDAVIQDIASHDEPIWVKDANGEWQRNQNRRSFDISHLQYKPKPFEQDSYFKSFDDVKRSDLAPDIVKNPKDMTQTVTTTSVFDQGAKDLVATRAVGKYMNDDGFKEMIDSLDPKQYNDFYKKNFGHDIQTPADLAAAYTLGGLQQKTVKSELKNDTYERQAALAKLNHNYRLGEKSFEHDLAKADKTTQDLWLQGLLDSETKNARTDQFGNKKPMAFYETGAGSTAGNEIPVTKFLADSFTKDGKSPDKLIVTFDDQFVPIYFKRDDKGNLLNDAGKVVKDPKEAGIINTYSVPQSRQLTIVDMGGKIGVKKKNEEAAAVVNKPAAAKSPTSATRAEWKASGWTDAQINKAVKEGKIIAK